MGFTGPEIFGVTKSFGVAATILGGLAGGIVVARYGLFKALLIAGILQAITNLLFSWQAQAGHDIVVLTIAISADNFTGALGGVAFIAYLSSLCTARHGGHAVCAADLADGVRPHHPVGRRRLARGADAAGRCSGSSTTLLAIPGLLLLFWLWRMRQKETPPSVKKEGQ